MFDELFRPLSLEKFVEEYYLKLPFAVTKAAAAWCELGSWTTIEWALAAGHDDFLLVRCGERRSADLPSDPSAVRGAVAEGYTLVLRHLERTVPAAGEVARCFERALVGAVDVHLYCTPPEQFGFGWHYDAEEVFIIQTTGDKEYSLRKNTVNPWPVGEALPDDMRYEREVMPLTKCRLRAGDWLYIPSGYWHMGRADEEAVSLAVGVRPTTGFDVLDFLRPQLRESMLWRRRFPPPHAAAASKSDDFDAAALAELAEDVRRRLTSPDMAAEFRRWLAARLRPEGDQARLVTNDLSGPANEDATNEGPASER